MIFTNQIAHVVHSSVHKSGGSVNKNIGDAFLAVWKVYSTSGNPLQNQSKTLGMLAENDAANHSLAAFLKVRALLESDYRIQRLAQDPRLQSKIPGYKVRMGYGLHFGWAIEGAVGSKHKVDATYLSPHVNMSARLESTSKQYGVQLLMSGPFYERLSEKNKEACRPIDNVTVKGSIVPIKLYTHFQSEVRHKKVKTSDSERFLALWKEAYERYIEGDWPEAHKIINSCLQIIPGDPPAELLLTVIDANDNKAPADWRGHRTLTSK